MANVDKSFGMRPVMHGNGAPYNGAVRAYFVPSGTVLYVGDPVVLTNNGSNTTVITNGTGNHPIGSLPEIAKAAATTATLITGAIVRFEPLPTNLEVLHSESGTERVALVADDPDLLFEIQADGTVAAGDINLNANLIFTDSGSAVTGQSGVELDTTGNPPDTTLDDQLKIIRVSDDPLNNDMTSANVNLLVKINMHSHHSETVGI